MCSTDAGAAPAAALGRPGRGMTLTEVGPQVRSPDDGPGPPRTRYAGGDDPALVERLRRGDPAAFDELVARFRPRLARLAYRLLGWSDEAEDVVQDVFVAALEHLPRRFRGGSSLATWLTAVTVNRCRRHRRRWVARWRRLLRLRERSGAPDAAAPAGELSEARDELRRVREAVQALPGRDREVVVLYYLEQHSVAEICQILGAGKGAIDVRLHRARKRLKELLADLETG